MKQETEQALNEAINILGKLLENENAQVVREGTVILKAFDAMLMVSNEWSRVYAGVIERAKLEEETFLNQDPALQTPSSVTEKIHSAFPSSPNQVSQPIPPSLCNCGLSNKVDDVEGSPMFGKKICDMTCKDSEQKAQGDTAEYIKFLSEESDENQTESDLNEAVEDISNFVDDQLGIVKPNQQAARSGELEHGHGKEKFKDNQYEPKSKVKITPVDNLQELIKERSEERGEALANERTKIKEASESEETHAQ